MKVSELITLEEVKQWKSGDIITISAGTGAGKSYFIKNDLYEYCKQQGKKILMLIHRRNCVDQFQMELDRDGKNDVIDIMTYQKLEAQARRFENIELGGYDVIVCDESHYPLFDSKFSVSSDLSLDAILNNNAIKILMSATGNQMKMFLNDYMDIKTIDYVISNDYRYIKHLEFFFDDVLEEYLKEAIEKGIKAIFFIQSAEKAYELHKKFKQHTMFNCSSGNSKYYRYVDQDKVNAMLENERFEDLILITTSVMDSGVNIVDPELHNVVCDIEDIGTLIQCVGRKRLTGEDDFIHLKVKALNKTRLGGMYTKALHLLNSADVLLQEGEQAYTAQNYRDNKDGIVNDEIDLVNGGVVKKVNQVKYHKLLYDKEMYAHLLSLKDGYISYVSNIFRKKNYAIYEKREKKMRLEQYLDSLVGKKLFKEDQTALIEKIDLKDARGRRQKGISLLNEYLKESKQPYYIVAKREEVELNGKTSKKTFWEIIGNIKH